MADSRGADGHATDRRGRDHTGGNGAWGEAHVVHAATSERGPSALARSSTWGRPDPVSMFLPTGYEVIGGCSRVRCRYSVRQVSDGFHVLWSNHRSAAGRAPAMLGFHGARAAHCDRLQAVDDPDRVPGHAEVDRVVHRVDTDVVGRCQLTVTRMPEGSAARGLCGPGRGPQRRLRLSRSTSV